MSIIVDPYYLRSEVSNSDLSALYNYFNPPSFTIDTTTAFRFGSLVDAMITEQDQVDLFNRRVGAIQFEKEEWEKARKMKQIFFADYFCQLLFRQCEMQKVSIKPEFEITYNDVTFSLPMRAKWDFYAKDIDLSGDLKTTAATTLSQFEDSINHYNYDRQAALYMDLEGKSNFMFIAISKENYKIFKVPVKKGGKIYNSGKEKYQKLAFMYYTLFGSQNNAL